MDLGKQKYGGPFKTKEVEDVKAFFGILKVVISIGPAFFLQFVTQSLLPVFSRHSKIYIDSDSKEIHTEGVGRHIFISNGLLSPLLSVFIIPVYICLIRPHVSYLLPGILKRIGMAIFLMIVSLLCSFIMDIIVHVKNAEIADCMLSIYIGSSMHLHVNDTTALQHCSSISCETAIESSSIQLCSYLHSLN